MFTQKIIVSDKNYNNNSSIMTKKRLNQSHHTGQILVNNGCPKADTGSVNKGPLDGYVSVPVLAKFPAGGRICSTTDVGMLSQLSCT